MVCTRASNTIEIDLPALRERYREERERRMRTDGELQYVEVEEVSAVSGKPHTVSSISERDAVAIDLDVAILGGGFAGMMTAAHLLQSGVDNFRILELGEDFGGTWYWNRYPGAQCDTDSYCYFPLLEETGYFPRHKYAFGPEIFEHCQRIGRHFGLYEKALFGTLVQRLSWDEGINRWRIATGQGDELRARFVVMAAGAYNRPKLPGIPGIARFRGHSFHTSRWDYDYTGGDSSGGLDKLTDKRVAIVGTGATAIQCIPHLGKHARHLYVLQRTPSAVDVRANRETDRDWVKSLRPGWQAERRQNYYEAFRTGLQPGVDDLVCDGWTSINAAISPQLGAFARGEITVDDLERAREFEDFRYQEKLRRRVDETITDEATREKLKAWYRFNCKRPTFHDEYLDTFNRGNVTLIDVSASKGVEAITERGFLADGVEHEVDCIIFASGFEVTSSMKRRLGIDAIEGRDGLSLYDHWGDGFRTLHGFMSDRFPNQFFTGYTQGAVSPNLTLMLDYQTNHIAHIIAETLRRRAETVEPTAEAVDYWQEVMKKNRVENAEFLDACTPGAYNNEGGAIRRSHVGESYAPGVTAFNTMLAEWRAQGDLMGMSLDGHAPAAHLNTALAGLPNRRDFIHSQSKIGTNASR